MFEFLKRWKSRRTWAHIQAAYSVGHYRRKAINWLQRHLRYHHLFYYYLGVAKRQQRKGFDI